MNHNSSVALKSHSGLFGPQSLVATGLKHEWHLWNGWKFPS